MLDFFDGCRDAKRIPHLLGIGAHPLLQLPQKGRTRDTLVRHLNYILYRADSSQFHNVKSEQKKHERAQDKSDRHGNKLVPVPKPLPASYDSVLRSALASHFQACAGGADGAMMLFSLLAAGEISNAVRTASLSNTLSGCRDLQLQCDVDLGTDGEMLPEVPQSHIFFSVTKPNPGDWHVVRASRAATARIHSTDVAVCMHHVIAVDGGVPVVCRQANLNSSEVGGGDPVHILKGLREQPVHVLQGELMRWDTSPALVYTVDGFAAQHARREDVAAIITSMVAAHSLPNSDEAHWFKEPSSASEKAILQELTDSDFTEQKCTAAGEVAYSLTFHALRSLRYGSKALVSAPALQPRAAVAICDMSTYEMIMTLEEQGFEWHKLPSKVADRTHLLLQPEMPLQ